MFTMRGIWSGSEWRMACIYLEGAAGLDLQSWLSVSMRNLSAVPTKAEFCTM